MKPNRAEVIVALSMMTSLALPVVASAAFGLVSTADYYQVDTGGGLVFKVRRVEEAGVNPNTVSVGDIRSLIFDGIEYQDPSRGTQINSGFDWLGYPSTDVSVSAQIVDDDHIKITVTTDHLTHYYMARRGDACIYMATYFAVQPVTGGGLCRFIVRMPSSLIPHIPEPGDIRFTTSTVESGDIFGMNDGTTRSKHYSNMRLDTWDYFGATGNNVGAWMVRDNHEGGSGGPFYRSLLQQCGSDQELTYIINYGQVQTEAFRTHILNHYTLAFTHGEAPGEPDTSWFGRMGLTGYVGPAGRGSVSCSGVSNLDNTYVYTAGFANANAQFWGGVSPGDGSFSVLDMLPGTYTMSIYKNELAVYTDTVAITAGSDTALAPVSITADPAMALPLWRIGDWDGTPSEFLNGDKVTTMHPSDVRMAGWDPGTYVVGTSAPGTGMPCYHWKGVGSGQQAIQFSLTAAQIMDCTVRIGTTVEYANARPQIKLNGWTSSAPTAPSPSIGTRSLTTGSYRGHNRTYEFSVPASSLNVGVNTLYVYPISGSGYATGFLSAGYSVDCIDMLGPLPQGAYYTLDGNALDSSGNNNNGNAVEAVYAANGPSGQNALFNGATSHIAIPRCIQDDFTVALWVKTTATGGSGTQWWNGAGLVDGEVAGSHADWGMVLLGGRLAVGIGQPDTTYFSASSINDGLWHHVAVTRNNSTGTVRLYVDGVLETTGAAPTGSRSEPSLLRIGSLQTGSGFFSGAIDQVILEDRIWSAAEIADTDGDGLKDGWEMTHFGHLSQTGDGDPDGDGADNETEETNGNSPLISSIPPFLDASVFGDAVGIGWPVNHTGWILEFRTNLQSGADWMPIPASDMTNFYETAANQTNVFFRLVYP